MTSKRADVDGDDLTPQEKLEVRQLRLMTLEQQKAWRDEMLGPPDSRGMRPPIDADEYSRRHYLLFKAEFGDDAAP